MEKAYFQMSSNDFNDFINDKNFIVCKIWSKKTLQTKIIAKCVLYNVKTIDLFLFGFDFI